MKYTTEQIEGKLTEVFESTLQSKSVDVSADTTITADDGFLGLKEVSVKVSGGGASYEYFDITQLDEMSKEVMSLLSFFVKGEIGGVLVIMPAAYADAIRLNISAAAIDLSATMYDNTRKEYVEMRVVFADMGVDLASLPRLTKEQFYTL